MVYQLALVCLAPVFIAQGKYVRWKTPKLPEPEGERSGVAGSGPALRVLIAGDSAAAGVGVTQQSDALTGQLIERLSEHRNVHWHLYAHSGDRASDLLLKLSQLEAQTFDAAVISIGVNDAVQMTSLNAWRENLILIIDTLQQQFSVQRVYLSCVPPMHLFPALPNPLRWWLGLRAKQLNGVMEDLVRDHAHCTFVDIPYSGNQQDIADDGFHPGVGAYKVWAEQLARYFNTSG